MTSSPTIPPFAARVWIEDNSIHMDLPAVGTLLSHRLTFPNNQQGLIRALHMLQARSHESKIGEPGDLTQWQLDKRLHSNFKVEGTMTGRLPKVVKKDTFSAAARQGARDIMRKLGVMP